MINYSKHTLNNGLTVIIHEDHTTPIAAVNTLYNVGSKNESPDKTGFAHLFEHLMFGGSKNVKDFDTQLQKVGGDNNAFTSTDITNYYVTLPSQNIETALWLESDRMLELSFDPQVLEVQRKVVIEEFKQRYLNQPYGDVWLKLRPLAYTSHPYRWPTIGKDISHIEDATMDDVKDFFFKYYAPNNAILVVAGNVNEEHVLSLVNKWYGDIPSRNTPSHELPTEPEQPKLKRESTKQNVPVDALYMVFHMPGKKQLDFYTADLTSDILGRGQSSRLYSELVKKKNIFSSISASITGSYDPGLLVVSGRLSNGIDIKEAEKHVWEVIEKFNNGTIEDYEIDKVRNQAETTLLYGETEVLNRAMNLAFHTVLGDTEMINREAEILQNISKKDISGMSNAILKENNCSILHYLSTN